MNTYLILIDQGYGFTAGASAGYVIAKTPQQARKTFLTKHDGAYYARPERIRATKISSIALPDFAGVLVAADWLPGGKYFKDTAQK